MKKECTKTHTKLEKKYCGDKYVFRKVDDFCFTYYKPAKENTPNYVKVIVNGKNVFTSSEDKWFMGVMGYIKSCRIWYEISYIDRVLSDACNGNRSGWHTNLAMNGHAYFNQDGEPCGMNGE